MRKPSDVYIFPEEVATKVQTAADLLRVIEQQHGEMNHTTEKHVFESLSHKNQTTENAMEYIRRVAPEFTEAILRQVDARNHNQSNTLFSNHLQLQPAIETARTLVQAESGTWEVPPVGILTRPTFNAAILAFKPVTAGSANASIQAIVVNYHLFLVLQDISFYLLWSCKAGGTKDLSATRKASMYFADYVSQARRGLRHGSGILPSTPPGEVTFDATVFEAFAMASYLSFVGLVFVLLHEIGHAQLHLRSYNIPTRSHACYAFNMAGDPHEREYEADAFAARHLARLLPGHMPADYQIATTKEQFETYVYFGVLALFVSIQLLTPSGSIIGRILMPTTHPSPRRRLYRVLERLGTTDDRLRLAKFTMRTTTFF